MQSLVGTSIVRYTDKVVKELLVVGTVRNGKVGEAGWQFAGIERDSMLDYFSRLSRIVRYCWEETK